MAMEQTVGRRKEASGSIGAAWSPPSVNASLLGAGVRVAIEVALDAGAAKEEDDGVRCSAPNAALATASLAPPLPPPLSGIGLSFTVGT